MSKEQYVWSIPLRLFHLVFVVSIVILTVTGFYIYSPGGGAVAEETIGFDMGATRSWHFIVAGAFVVSVLLRLVLFVGGGTKYEKFTDFAPVNNRNLKNLFSTIAYYLYLTDKHERRLGHNALAGSSYIGIVLVSLVQILSGFCLLYPESGLWQGTGLALFGSIATVRFVHHIFTWLFILFAVIHVYIAVWNHVRTPAEGMLLSIFTGKKQDSEE